MDTRTLTRRTLIDIARRHQRAGVGSAPAFLTQRTTLIKWIDLTPIQWAVVGAAATRLYMPERMTRDLDIAIRIQVAQAARQKLTVAGFAHQGEWSIGSSTWRAPSGEMIDVIEEREMWWNDALVEAQTNRDAQGLPILPFRYLVLMKFQSERVQDVADITRMLGQADATLLNALRALFKRSSPSDLPDLESLITLGKLEIDDESKR